MSYQVLARKWRPHTFRELVGQTHVLRALVNALDRDQLHHAYLFTGTRGVGKTTIARILATCLNCETGVSSEPCGTCSACTEIAEGRFVDLIEVDAASRTKVEDTRELLENVQYAPVRGRYKVFLIDEVHMLSTHSFNALLKTLEEPPPHVKFLLATTAPRKLPATVLSRCLQFHLKNMSPDNIVKHLTHVLGQEMIGFEPDALNHLAYAAEGSMRDALSLTDQAIAFGGGEVKDQEVRDMLGSIDRASVWKLLEALRDNNAAELLEKIQNLADHSADFTAVLDELLHCLHLLMREQLVPNSDINIEYKDKLTDLSAAMSPEQVQLYYQIAINGRKDIAYAPTARQGAEVALLRMLAFKPLTGVNEISPEKKPKRAVSTEASPGPAARIADSLQAEPANSTPNPPAPVLSNNAPPEQVPPFNEVPPKLENEREPIAEPEAIPEPVQPPVTEPEPKLAPETAVKPEPTPEAKPAPVLKPISGSAQQQWLQLFPQLAIRGVIKSMASQCEAVSIEADHWQLVLNEAHAAMHKPEQAVVLAEAIGELFAKPVKVSVTLGNTSEFTPVEQARQMADTKYAQALEALQNDGLVQALLEQYDARIDPDSVRLIDQ